MAINSEQESYTCLQKEEPALDGRLRLQPTSYDKILD